MRFQDLTGRTLAEDTTDLMEFQDIRKIFWNQKNSEWTYRFEVGGNMFQLFMMDALAASPTTGEQVGGVDVAFARMRMQRGAIWAHDTDNTGDTGSQARAVFSHVVSGIIDYCKRRDPQFIEFQANVDQGKSKLYATIYNYLAKRAQTFGYVAPQVHDNGSGADHFVLWHESELQGGGDIRENATAGATSAASVATVPGGRKGQVGGLGVGFDPNGDQGIYAGKPKKKKNSGDGVIRR